MDDKASDITKTDYEYLRGRDRIGEMHAFYWHLAGEMLANPDKKILIATVDMPWEGGDLYERLLEADGPNPMDWDIPGALNDIDTEEEPLTGEHVSFPAEIAAGRLSCLCDDPDWPCPTHGGDFDG